MNTTLKEWLDRIAVMEKAPLADYRNYVSNAVAEITQSTLAYFATVNPAGSQLTMIGWSKSAMVSCSMTNKPLVYKVSETGLWGDAIRERKPVITNDYPNLVKATKKGYPAGHVTVRRHMNLPIFDHQHIVLVVGVGNKSAEYTLADANDVAEFMNRIWPTLKNKLNGSTG